MNNGIKRIFLLFITYQIMLSFFISCDRELTNPHDPLVKFDAPSNLSANISSSSVVKLNWIDNTDDEDGFIIERKAKNGEFQIIQNIPKNVTTYACSTFTLGDATEYYFRVRAKKGSFLSEPQDSIYLKFDGQLQWIKNMHYYIAEMEFLSEGDQLLVSDCDVKLLISSTGNQISSFGLTGFVNSFCLNDNENILFAGAYEVGAWQIADRYRIWTNGDYLNYNSEVVFIKYSQNRVTVVWTDKIQMLDAANGNLIWHKDDSIKINSIVFSPDGSKIVSGGDDGFVKIRNSDSGELLWSGGHAEEIYSVAYSADCSLIASGSNTLKVWSANTGMIIWEKEVGQVGTLAFTPDGEKLMCGSIGLKVFESTSGNLLWSGDQGYIYSIDIHNQDHKIVSGSYDNTLKVWNLDNGFLYWAGNHSGRVLEVEFSPDPSVIVSGDNNGVLKSWKIGWAVIE